MRIGRSLVVLGVAVGALFSSASAGADTPEILMPQNSPPNSFDGFLAGPCVGEALVCSPTTPGLFFKAAGGHPTVGFVHFNVRHAVIEPEVLEPLAEPLQDHLPKDLRVDLPPGLSVNPEAAPEKCSLADFRFKVEACGPGARIGEVKVTAVSTVFGVFGKPKGGRIDTIIPAFTRADLYDLQPRPGEPALFGFKLLEIPILLVPELSFEGDYHEAFTIRELPNLSETPGLQIAIHSARLITFGKAGDGTLATLPTTCFDPAEFPHLYSSWIRMDSYGQPIAGFPFGSVPVEGTLPPGARPERCESVPFEPSIDVTPGASEVDSPAAPTVTTRLQVETPANGGGRIAESHLRTAEVTLPAGMGLNPAGAAGLDACTDEQFHRGDRNLANECPTRSQVGTVELSTPVLSEKLVGAVYVGEPRGNDPTSGEEFRLFVEATSIERGVAVRLVGKVKPDPASGQLTAIFDEHEVGEFAGALPHGLPQLPFSSLTLRLDGSPTVLRPPILTSPPTCSTATTTAKLEPWAQPGSFVPVQSSFTLTEMPGGGVCPQTLAERPFDPPYSAGPDSARAASYSALHVSLIRPEGQQELKRLELTLPKGMIGKLAGIPYCSEAQIAAVQGGSGKAEKRAPSCPAASLLGSTATEAGIGNAPLSLPGNAYLAGPYKGAPLSIVAITPALAGPYDLGNVVVRIALRLDPESAQITAVSDPIPDVFGGVKVSLRSIDLNLDRDQFTLNPTNCAAQAITGTINGGGADPTNPGAFSSFPLKAPFQAGGCAGLGFKPSLQIKLSGPTKRSRYPRLTATLTPRPGDANVAGVDLTLPHSLFVAQEHISTVCNRTQLAAQACPAGAVYGQASASSPLLDAPLEGPVYLVPGGHQLPDMLVDLRGQVNIQLRGVISSKKGGIRVVFDNTPDVPLTQFTLNLAGGRKSLIVNSENLCKSRRPAVLKIRGQNGAQLTNNKFKLKLSGCAPRRKKRRKGRG